LFSNSQARGKAGLATLSITMDKGIISRDTIERRMGPTLPPEQSLHVRQGDLAYNMMRMWQGAVGVSPIEGVVSPAYVVCRPKIKKVDARFMYYVFKSHHGLFRLRAFSHGITDDRLRLYFDDFASIPVQCPTLREQCKIADILSTWDEALTQLDAVIEAQERCKKALMQQLLTGRRRLKGFRKPWMTAKLGTLFKERVEQGRIDLPLLSITADRGIVRRSDVAKRDSSSEDKSKYLRIVPGDIGYNTMRMWQGVSALSALEGIVSPAYTICTPTERIDGRFAAHFFKLRHTVHLFHRYSQGLVDDTLNLKFQSFAVIEVSIPSDLEEQRQIASILDTADQQLTLLRTQRTALDQQKRGLMQRLLTGKLRARVT